MLRDVLKNRGTLTVYLFISDRCNVNNAKGFECTVLSCLKTVVKHNQEELTHIKRLYGIYRTKDSNLFVLFD